MKPFDHAHSTATMLPHGMQRMDIQALRGIAVLYVVIYHADLGFLINGFLGVDIFFVISGYLITGMICKELDAGDFSVRTFYWRRAKRLLPATYCMLIVVALLSVFSLTKIELANFISQLFGSLTFVSNIILWRQAGYFDVSAELKPLLHMWSLSIEEQFYLLLPMLLIITSYRYRNKIVFAALLASLLLCFAIGSGHPSANFYLLPTRAWELLIGSMGATWPKPDFFRKVERNLGLLSVAIILVLPVIQIDPIHPRFDALIVCLATLISLWTRPTILRNNGLAAALGKVGDISFSLYLVHWPLFALARNIYIGELPTGLRVAIATISLPLAVALYRFVENPIHRSSIQPTRLAIAATCLAAIVILAIPATRLAGSTHQQDWAEIRRANFGFDDAKCDQKTETSFFPLRECRNSDHPQIAVWGDSYAMALVSGMKATDPGLGVIQATRSVCGPFFALATVYKNNGAVWPPDICLKFNESVSAYLAAAPSIRYVVLTSAFDEYLDGSDLVLGTGERVPNSPALVIKELGKTVLGLRAMGKKVVIVAPPPHGGFNMGLCVERLKSGLWKWNAPQNCLISTDYYHESDRKVISMLKDTSLIYDVSVIWLSDYLCDVKTCKTYYGDAPVYNDGGHLSYSGSEAIFKGFDLFNKITNAAK
jgi:peptidoglycan/LPS O-acetylase OafA/YrhL